MRHEPAAPQPLRLPRFLNAVLFLGGIGLSVFWIITMIGTLTGPSAPFGVVESTDPIRSGPYGDSSPDRWVANELHATNKLLEDLLKILDEIRARIGE